MSNDKMSKEELKKLEDEAYYELCQIIAEAIETQDVGLLDTRIAAWKSKYKKLLDGSNPNFKKRIEYLLNYYYSEVTQYILSQIRIKEKKVIENQAKAIRKLYLLIKNTNDLATLKKEVEKWKQKYPVDSFLKMYQKRIESYTKVKNLEENAFDQEQAFKDLVEVSKSNEYLDDLKQKLQDWEEKYSINDKYSIDDFLKHQSEVKRFTSDDFLISIAKPEEHILDGIYHGTADKPNLDYDSSNSSLSAQTAAYNKLISICKDPNNIDQVFNWVYRNRDIKFNDKYKELILAATYLNYSPTYLNKLSAPNIDLSVESLSFVNNEQISQIKKYAIISYFNLLLPPDKTVTNTYFNNHILKLYNNSKKIDHNVSPNDSILSDEILSLGTQIELTSSETTIKKEEPLTLDTAELLANPSENTNIIIDLPTKPKTSKEESIQANNSEPIKISNISESSEKDPTEIIEDGNSSKEERSVPKNSTESFKNNDICEKQHIEVNDDVINEEKEEKIITPPFEGDVTLKEEDEEKEETVINITQSSIDIPNPLNKKNAIDITKNSNEISHQSEKISLDVPPIVESTKSPDDNVSDKIDLEIEIEPSETNSILEQDSQEIVIKATPTNNLEASSTELENSNSELEHKTIIAIAPQFFELVNNYCIEHTLINVIDNSVNNYIQNSSEHIEEDKSLETTYPDREIRTTSN